MHILYDERIDGRLVGCEFYGRMEGVQRCRSYHRLPTTTPFTTRKHHLSNSGSPAHLFIPVFHMMKAYRPVNLRWEKHI